MFRKLIFAALAAFTLGLVGLGFAAKTASAEVTFNERIEAVRSPTNPCESWAEPVYFSGAFHHVWYTTPDGTLKMNIQGQLTGTDADGVEWRLITQQHMEHWEPFPPPPPGGPYTDRVRMKLISKGSTVNALTVITVDTSASNPVVTVTACRG
jgi:hypothetical protein